jgi:hypothetical protein
MRYGATHRGFESLPLRHSAARAFSGPRCGRSAVVARQGDLVLGYGPPAVRTRLPRSCRCGEWRRQKTNHGGRPSRSRPSGPSRSAGPVCRVCHTGTGEVIAQCCSRAPLTARAVGHESPTPQDGPAPAMALDHGEGRCGLSFASRARRGTSGALYLQSAPAGLNSLPRPAPADADGAIDVEDRVPRSGDA